LLLIGLGLHDASGLSQRGLELARTADSLFIETYTAKLAPGSLERLQAWLGRPPQQLTRTELEQGTRLFEAAAQGSAALLVPGDPLVATTHVELLLEARRRGLRTEVVPGASILSAAPGLLGLQHYKFGRTTSLPYPSEGYFPTSPYEVIEENLSRGLHTLVLLDLPEEGGAGMSVSQAVEMLLELERREGRGVITPERLIGALLDVGSREPTVRVDSAVGLLNARLEGQLACLIVPGTTHFKEAEALRVLGGAPPVGAAKPA